MNRELSSNGRGAPVAAEAAASEAQPLLELRQVPFAIAALVLMVLLYRESARELYINYTLVDSYYNHGFFIPFISLFIVWLRRRALFRAPAGSSPWGFAWIAGAGLLLIAGKFLGFRVFSQFSMIPMLVGLSYLFLGAARTRVLWFAFAFLIFMIPIPPSLTQSISLKLKLTATDLAVGGAKALTLPIVQQGSFIHFPNGDHLLVGEVCGGLRSLIALLALGALMAYLSRTRAWCRWLILVMSVPVAIFTNVLRIFALCVVGYYQGSAVAAGTFHDVSGVMIFVVAFGLFMGLEKLLVRFFPAGDSEAPEDVGAQAPAVVGHTPRRRRPVAWAAVAVVLLASLTGGRMAIARAQEASVEGIRQQEALTFPDRIGGYTRMSDVKISEDVKRALETSNILVRNYISPQGPVAQLTIVHAGTTRRSLHFPEVCLVGNGWEIREQEVVQVGFTFHARRLVLVKGDQREAVLYWFKTGDTLTGNYFLNAFYWARNQLTFGSPTSAMFKVSMRFARGGEEEAFQVLEDFAVKLREPILTHVP